MKRIALALVGLAMILAGCVPVIEAKAVPLSSRQVAEVKRAVTYRLRDPDSAQFRNIHGVEQTLQDGSTNVFVCGQVNGRNGFGGYAGFGIFLGRFEGSTFKVTAMASREDAWIYLNQCPGIPRG